MKTTLKTLTGLGVIAALGAGMALAANPGLANLGNEVETASLRVPEGTESQAELAKLARITQAQAESAALAVLPGQVTQAKLDDENGFLVWQIDIKHPQGVTEIAVDAGDGRVLAADHEDGDEEHEGDEGHEGEHEGRGERRG